MSTPYDNLETDDGIANYYATLQYYANMVDDSLPNTIPASYRKVDGRSKICGSYIMLAALLDEGAIKHIYIAANSCVVGKTASYLCYKWAQDKYYDDGVAALQHIDAFLHNKDYDKETYNFLTLLEPVIMLRAKHDIIRLPFMLCTKLWQPNS